MRERSSFDIDEWDAGLIKGMLDRGDPVQQIASYFGVNIGRVSEIRKNQRFAHVPVAPNGRLPPKGPYPSGREALEAIKALRAIDRSSRQAIIALEHVP